MPYYEETLFYSYKVRTVTLTRSAENSVRFFFCSGSTLNYMFDIPVLNGGLQCVMESYLAILLSNDSIAFRTVNPVLNLKLKAHNYPNIL